MATHQERRITRCEQFVFVEIPCYFFKMLHYRTPGMPFCQISVVTSQLDNHGNGIVFLYKVIFQDDELAVLLNSPAVLL